MPDFSAILPDDLELLRIGLRAEERLHAARYTLSGHTGSLYCLIEGSGASLAITDIGWTLQGLLDHSDDPSSYAYEALEDMMGVVWTNGLKEASPSVFSQHEFTPISEDYALDGHITSVEVIRPEALNSASRLTGRQVGTIQMAFDRVAPEDFLSTARLLGSHDLDPWHAFEVCEAISIGAPKAFVADIANPLLTHRQARGLRRLSQTFVDNRMCDGTRGRTLFHQVAARTDFPEDRILAINAVLRAAPHLDFEDGWLGLSTDQLRSVRLALSENVPPATLRRYATGSYPAQSMDILTLAVRDGQIGEPQLDRLLNPRLDAGQLAESWAAAIDCGCGRLPAPAFDLICAPALPQPVMNALRLGLTYGGLPLDLAASSVTPDSTREQVWKLVDSAKHEPAREDGASDASAIKGAKRPGTLHGAAKELREASGSLGREAKPGIGNETRE